jgi:conjugative transfer signal peptidase TraF
MDYSGDMGIRTADIKLSCADGNSVHDDPLRNADQDVDRHRCPGVLYADEAGAAIAVVRLCECSDRVYSVEPVEQLAVTNLVVAMPPNSLATFLAERVYVPLGVPLIKRVLAVGGQSVCRNELAISIDGIAIGMALAHDRQGRPLPAWQGCRAIAQDEVFLMNWDEPTSFDGRYFGPIPLCALIGRAKPLWTLDKP